MLLCLWLLAAALAGATAATEFLSSSSRMTLSRRGKLRVPVKERQALMSLFHSTDGKQWRNSKHWGYGDPCRDRWSGVMCAGDKNGRPTVTVLKLAGNQLRGVLPPLIDERQQRATSKGNYLGLLAVAQKGVPADISKEYFRQYLSVGPPPALPNLRILDLGDNQLHGPVPAAISGMTELRELWLGRNTFTEIPATINNLRKLEILELYDNQLTSIPPLNNLAQLLVLDITKNMIDSEVPNWLGDLPELRILAMGDNMFYGAINPSLCKLSNLMYLKMHDNLLNGTIPDCITNLWQINALRVSGNALSGRLPREIGNLQQLTYLDVSENALTGPIPESLRDIQRLRGQHQVMHGNTFGRAPLWFETRFPHVDL